MVLQDHVKDNIQDKMKNWKVENLVKDNGEWDWSLLNELFQQNILNRIVVIHPPSKELGIDDGRWGASNNGELSIASAYKNWSDMGNYTDHRDWKAIWCSQVSERVEC